MTVNVTPATTWGTPAVFAGGSPDQSGVWGSAIVAADATSDDDEIMTSANRLMAMAASA